MTDSLGEYRHPGWSPDGTKIAFSSNNNIKGYDDIWVITTDGTNLVNLTNGLASFFPAWSPDGTKIAFSVPRDSGSLMDIFVMNADGTNVTNLTADQTGGGRLPTWSPDGTRIAYTGADLGLAIMNADGTNPVSLQVDMPSTFFYDPDWSPDGTGIAFSAVFFESTITSKEFIGVFSINPDGSNLVQLTGEAARDIRPTWSPDGTKIAFQSDRDGQWDIWIMEADGTNPVNLTKGQGGGHPAWSPIIDHPSLISTRSWGQIKAF